MNREPLISVIIPVYNTEQYVKECLDSVMNQTYKDLEIICVNDGSTDGSLDILKSLAETDSRIKIINQENQGPLSARNNGLKAITGEYFIFIDSDDFLTPDAINSLYSLMIQNDTRIAFTNFEIRGKANYRYDKNLLLTDELLKDVFNSKSVMFPCWGVLINRCYIDSEFTGYHLCEDELYALDIFIDTDRVSYSSTPVVTYRNKAKRPKNKDINFYWEGYLAAKEFYCLVEKSKPHLQNYAKCRLLMHTFFCYFNIRTLKGPDEKLNEMKNIIRTYRRDVLKNKDAHISVKLVSALSYLGLGLTSGIYNTYTKIDR